MNEQFSQWLDGELDDESWSELMATVKAQPQWQDRWDTYHLIGDAMRGTPAMSADFADRFAARLAQEPTVLAPAVDVPKRGWQWGVSMAASMAGIAAVALGASQVLWPASFVASPAVMAQQKAPPPMQDYMLAHQQLASHGEPIEQPLVVAYETKAGQ